MAGIVYLLCTLTALGCACLLLVGYKRTQTRLLLWSGLCFIGLTLNNLLVFIDLLVFPEIDLSLSRNTAALLGMVLLLYGLIWEAN